ncbi:leucine-rich repeat domain-containing protein [Verrucomicrobium sp. BvORR034]|uniref:leucine-rich repeat domain-containing protein n=1 Tax=Verrucomicrobium sp. BvORR034 TaxID=1396418 RepID=UPI002240EAAE|nr:leucine-rich repeat domain-containing protein [Verrucomicrobium sp. BvORR034]
MRDPEVTKIDRPPHLMWAWGFFIFISLRVIAASVVLGCGGRLPWTDARNSIDYECRLAGLFTTRAKSWLQDRVFVTFRDGSRHELPLKTFSEINVFGDRSRLDRMIVESYGPAAPGVQRRLAQWIASSYPPQDVVRVEFGRTRWMIGVPELATPQGAWEFRTRPTRDPNTSILSTHNFANRSGSLAAGRSGNFGAPVRDSPPAKGVTTNPAQRTNTPRRPTLARNKPLQNPATSQSSDSTPQADPPKFRNVAPSPTLKVLDFSGATITDNDLQALSQVPNLEEVDLSNSKVTAKGLKRLLILRNLKTIRIEGTSITKEALAAFWKQHANLYQSGTTSATPLPAVSSNPALDELAKKP